MRRRRAPALTGVTPLGEQLVLRPLTKGDRDEFLALRTRNAAWLRPWDPTVPPGGPPRRDISADFRGYVRALDAEAQQGSGLSLVIVTGGGIVGMVSASSIVRGAMLSSSLGYWVGREVAGRWIAPTAVAALGDHLLAPNGIGLHRIQVDIRPDNTSSLAVVAKLGLREEGFKRGLLHIDGRWRDHRSFAITVDELGRGGLGDRLSQAHQASRARHTE